MPLVRKSLASLCCATGGLLGLWQGMLAVPTDSPSPHLWTALGDVMVPVGTGVSLGVALGALVATGVCASIPWLRPARDRA
jgi:hypothetical protein